MRNDPFSVPACAYGRPAGHELPASRGKIAGLFPPLQATGVPLGGIGTGGITRSSDGRFSRWTIKAGGVRSFAMPANGFVLRVRPEGEAPIARALQPGPDNAELSGFTFEETAPDWNGLFPFAWHRHEVLAGVTAECLSYSPILAGDIAASRLPVALFRWRLINRGTRPAEASLAFHFANLNGWFDDSGEGRPPRVTAGCFNHLSRTETERGVILDRRRVADVPPEGSGQWAIAMAEGQGLHLSQTAAFDGIGDGADFWRPFHETGDAPDLGESWLTESGFRETPPGHPTAAVAARTKLAPGEEREVLCSLAWDLPTISFGQGRRWFRGYTEEYGQAGCSAEALTRRALTSATDWEQQIETWQTGIAAELGDAPHRAGQAINEAYFLVDGLTVLTAATDAEQGRARFGIIECHDYALYNTLDLWIYAAEGVARFFPELAASVARDYADHLLAADTALRRHRWDSTTFAVNTQDICPHDLGGPGEDPFVTANSYTFRDGTRWKDLNCDLVLCIYREGQEMGADWRRALYPAVKAAIGHLQQFVLDDSGLIQNDGTPDQTFDNIPMGGVSSYCGGLWIAALLAGAQLAEEAGDDFAASCWIEQAARAKAAYNARLFNGAWFRVDTDGPLSEACFIEQLLGPFLARRMGLGDIVADHDACMALRSIYQRNFLEAGGGEGAVSLSGLGQKAQAVLPHQDDTSFQTSEIQPGFNFSFAAQLEEWDLHDEAETLRMALYRELSEIRNLAFQAPAAFDRGRLTCRAVLNMRPLSVWWMKGRNLG